MENKAPEQEIKIESSFGKKFENFWYYHKWKVIVAAFVAVVLAVCVYSCVVRPKVDITVVYAGPMVSTNQCIPVINENLSDIMPESVGKNGASVIVLSIFEDEEYRNITTDSYKSLGNYLGMGNYSIYMLDPDVYEYYKSDKEIFVPLEEIFGDDLPASAYYKDAIKLSETKLYKNNPNGIGKLPKDTIVCIRVETPFSTGCSGQGGADDYQRALDMFKEIAK